MSRKRILFLAEGATMAHFVRPLALAESLVNQPYDVYFYAPSRFSPHLQNKPFIVGELRTMPGEQFLANISKGAPMFPLQVLREYVKQDRELIGRVRPDLVVGDMRPSLPVSARLEKVPCAVMMNAYWSPYAKRRSIVPELPLTRVIPPRWLGPLVRLAEPVVYRLHVGRMNRVRKEYGMHPLPPDLGAMYMDGDYVLYPDVPAFVPTHNAPETHQYVGICEWSPANAKPEWWARMLDDPKPKVFVGLGSSGSLRILPLLLRALSTLPVAVIISTSGRDWSEAGSAAYVADLLPFTETARASAVVVSNGGSAGLNHSMAAGTPVLGLPSNADQHLATAVMEENGAGLGVRVEEASEERLRRALARLLSEPQFKLSAQRWSSVYARCDSGALFGKFLSDVFEQQAH